MHVSEAFKLITNEYPIFKNFSREDYQKIRERIISMVLSTDMSKHFEKIGKLKGRLAAGDFDPSKKD